MLTTIQFKKMILAGLLSKSALLGKLGGGGADVGGGDLVRADFLNRGAAVVEFLKNTKDGQQIVFENNLKIDQLETALDVNIIKISDETLIDRTGSVVDALGEPGLILLNKKQWTEYAENDLDNYFLVFHEMLRENGINDDNYIISKKISNFSEDYKIKNVLNTKKPLLAEDNLSDVIQKKEIIFGGTGCKSDSIKTWTRFDSASNQFEIYPNEMKIAVGVNQKKIDRTSCAIRIPFKSKPGQKMVITQIDLSGEVDLQKNKKMSIDFTADVIGGSEKQKNKTIVSGTQNLSAGFLFRENKNFETKCGTTGMIQLNAAASVVDLAATQDQKVSIAKVGKIILSIKSVPCLK